MRVKSLSLCPLLQSCDSSSKDWAEGCAHSGEKVLEPCRSIRTKPPEASEAEKSAWAWREAVRWAGLRQAAQPSGGSPSLRVPLRAENWRGPLQARGHAVFLVGLPSYMCPRAPLGRALPGCTHPGLSRGCSHRAPDASSILSPQGLPCALNNKHAFFRDCSKKNLILLQDSLTSGNFQAWPT